jgi:hypothetical protein
MENQQMKNWEDELDAIFIKIYEYNAKYKATLKGIDLMKWNLYWKLHHWMMREDTHRCVTVGELVDKVQDHAPKTILKNREAFVSVVNNLWSVTHSYTIDSVDDLLEDLEFALSYIFKEN